MGRPRVPNSMFLLMCFSHSMDFSLYLKSSFWSLPNVLSRVRGEAKRCSLCDRWMRCGAGARSTFWCHPGGEGDRGDLLSSLSPASLHVVVALWVAVSCCCQVSATRCCAVCCTLLRALCRAVSVDVSVPCCCPAHALP